MISKLFLFDHLLMNDPCYLFTIYSSATYTTASLIFKLTYGYSMIVYSLYLN